MKMPTMGSAAAPKGGRGMGVRPHIHTNRLHLAGRSAFPAQPAAFGGADPAGGSDPAFGTPPSAAMAPSGPTGPGAAGAGPGDMGE